MPAVIKPKWDGIMEFLTDPETAVIVADIADSVAARAAAATGQVDGAPAPTVTDGYPPDDDPVMRREDDPTDERVRSAVIVHHPTEGGRTAATAALKAALGTHYNGGTA